MDARSLEPGGRIGAKDPAVEEVAVVRSGPGPFEKEAEISVLLPFHGVPLAGGGVAFDHKVEGAGLGGPDPEEGALPDGSGSQGAQIPGSRETPGGPGEILLTVCRVLSLHSTSLSVRILSDFLCGFNF